MNELDFIRRQVATERSHMAAVRSACAAALARQPGSGRDIDFLLACAGYLVFIVGRFNAQDQAHSERLRPRVPATATREHAVLDDLQQTLAASRRAIAALETAWRARESGAGSDPAFVGALRTFLSFLANVLIPPRHAIHHLLDAHYGIVDWRAASAVDADAILEERTRYARVADLLPDGVVLAERMLEGAVFPPGPPGTADASRPPGGT